MPQPKNLDAYSEEIELLDEALDSEKGLQITLPTAKDAFTKRMRLYAARKHAIALHKEVHPGTRSAYTALKIVTENEKVFILKVTMEVQPL